MVYGYCRVSTRKQSIERQIINILQQFPGAEIIKETYTGTKLYGRKELEKLIAEVTKKMQKAAAELNFEAAVELRDKMMELKKTLLEMED